MDKLGQSGRGLGQRLLWASLFLLVALPTLLAIHRYPQTVFFNEWFAGLLLVLSTLLAAAFARPHRLTVSSFVLALGIVAVAGAATWPAARHAGGDYFVYASAAILAGMLAQAAARIFSGGSASVTTCLATGITACAVLHCVASVCQLAGFSPTGWVMPMLRSSAYGNIAQANHFANLLWLAQVSLIYLCAAKRLHPVPAVFLSLVLSVFSALSASRSVWLYTVGIPALSLLYARTSTVALRRRVVPLALAVFAGSVFAQFLASFDFIGNWAGVASAAERIDEPGSNGQRLFDWWVALRTVIDHPFTGAGLGSFPWQSALWSIGLPEAAFIRVAENAHNTVLHLAAEMGLLLCIVLLALAGRWLWRRIAHRGPGSAETLWGLGVIAVIGLHSMVEYPLWYTYFVIPFGLAIGIVDAGEERTPTLRFNSLCLLAPAAIGAVLLAWTWADYKALEEGYALINDDAGFSAEQAARADAIGAAVSQYSLFATHAGILRLRAWDEKDKAQSKTMSAICDNTMRAKPSYAVLEKCVHAYAQQNRHDAADIVVAAVCGAYPPGVRRDFGAVVAAAYQPRRWPLPAWPACI